MVRALPRPLRPPARRRGPPARRGASSRRCSPGAPTPARRRSRSAAARAWWAASSRALPDGYAGAVTIDLRRWTACSRSTRSRRAARIQAGATGPGARGAAARARPDAAPLPAVVRVLDARRLDRHARGRPLRHARTPTSTTSWSRCGRSRRAGVWESRRLPGSGAGPSPDRHADRLGGHPRRDHRGLGAGAGGARASRTRPRVLFDGFEAGRRGGARAGPVAASTRRTAACSTRARRALTGAAPDGRALLVLGFESADRPARRLAWRARSSCAATTAASTASRDGERGESEGAWRDAFLQAPYLRDTLIAGGHPRRDLRDRDHLGPLRRLRGRGARARRARRSGPTARVTCRLTHAYPDGAAPYFTVLAPARRGSELEQWDEVKAAASEAIEAAGRHDHPPPRGRPRPPALVRPPAPRAVRRGAAARPRRRVDPHGILNPGRAGRTRDRAEARARARRPRAARALAPAPAAALARACRT